MRSLILALLFTLSQAAWAGGGEHAAAEGHGGIPLGEIGFHALNLAILLGLLWRFAVPAIRDSVANRAAGIQRQIDEAGKSAASAEARYQELDARLSGFEAELARMKAEAETEAARERETILARGERDAAQIREAAERTVRTELIRARQELRQDAAHLAVQMAEQRLAANLRSEDEERFANEFLGSIRGVKHG